MKPEEIAKLPTPWTDAHVFKSQGSGTGAPQVHASSVHRLEQCCAALREEYQKLLAECLSISVHRDALETLASVEEMLEGKR